GLREHAHPALAGMNLCAQGTYRFGHAMTMACMPLCHHGAGRCQQTQGKNNCAAFHDAPRLFLIDWNETSPEQPGAELPRYAGRSDTVPASMPFLQRPSFQ